MTEDVQAIKNLLFRYAELVDGGDFEGVGQLFEHATVDWGGMETTGSEAVTRQFETTTRLHGDGTPGTSHVITNVIVETEVDRAAARSRYVVLQQTSEAALAPIISGRYEDTFVRLGDTWHFSTRTYRIDLVGDLSHHLTDEVLGSIT